MSSSTLKFKVTSRGIWNVSDDASRKGTTCGKRKPETEAPLDGQRCKNRKTDLSKDKSSEGKNHRVSVGGCKATKGKISMKMDRHLKLECSKILKELMSHSLGWVFSEPVDPVKLKIPDYFEIVKHPMDLGTIKHKLEGNRYSDAKEFADDVKLTFENAKSYNPPSHEVHRWAEVLDANFGRRWKVLDTRLKLTKKNDEEVNFCQRTGDKDTRQVPKPVGFTKALTAVKLGNTRRVLLEERQKSRPVPMQVNHGKIAINGSSLNKTAEKEPCSRRTSSSGNLRQSIVSTEAKCLSSVSPRHLAVQSDILSERSSEYNHYGDSKLDCEVKCNLASLANSFALDLDDLRVNSNEERSPCSTPATPPVSVEGWMADVQMSPSKALRVARLKSRFADTIFRATHSTLLTNGEKSDLSSIHQERLLKEKLKEKARIEEQIKAAEAASRRKEQDDLKMRRERERKAARMALEKMERTVEIDKTASILKDLEILFGRPTGTGYPNAKALERLGLYIKDKYLEEDEDAILNVEEGEILC